MDPPCKGDLGLVRLVGVLAFSLFYMSIFSSEGEDVLEASTILAFAVGFSFPMIPFAGFLFETMAMVLPNLGVTPESTEKN